MFSAVALRRGHGALPEKANLEAPSHTASHSDSGGRANAEFETNLNGQSTNDREGSGSAACLSSAHSDFGLVSSFGLTRFRQVQVAQRGEVAYPLIILNYVAGAAA